MDIRDLPISAQQKVLAILGQDVSELQVQCEALGCTTTKQLGDMFSMAVIYRMPGRGKAPYQCENEQHFGCCHEHAMVAMLSCLVNHIEGGDHGDVKDASYKHSLLRQLEKHFAEEG